MYSGLSFLAISVIALFILHNRFAVLAQLAQRGGTKRAAEGVARSQVDHAQRIIPHAFIFRDA